MTPHKQHLSPLLHISQCTAKNTYLSERDRRWFVGEVCVGEGQNFEMQLSLGSLFRDPDDFILYSLHSHGCEDVCRDMKVIAVLITKQKKRISPSR